MFKAALVIPNISIPKEWFVELINYVDSVPNPEPDVPKVIDLKVLQRLCDEYRYVIGAGINWKKPSIQIRYVIDEDKFGNAWFGSFFFFGDTLYVWDRDEAWAPEHNADVVDAVFKDECFGRGYAHRVLYAGVRTRYKDSMGEFIYTGDVCHIKHHSREYDLPLSTLGSEENPDFFRYAFVLDNQCIYPEDCDSITRVGTVFFMLDRNDDGDLVDQLSRRFTDVMGQSPYSLPQRLNMAQYTPSFYKDVWKYESMRVLEIEYNWRE